MMLNQHHKGFSQILTTMPCLQRKPCYWHRRWYLSGGIQYDTDGKEIIQST